MCVCVCVWGGGGGGGPTLGTKDHGPEDGAGLPKLHEGEQVHPLVLRFLPRNTASVLSTWRDAHHAPA